MNCGAEVVFKEKNEIARALFAVVCKLPGAPRIVVMDSFFMTKENIHGLLTVNGVDSRPIGQLKEGFTQYCQGRLADYLSSLKEQCQSCQMIDWIFHHLYKWAAEKPWKEEPQSLKSTNVEKLKILNLKSAKIWIV